MNNDEPEKFRIVTMGQLAEGYMEKDGAFIRNRPYRIVGPTNDGNVIVYNPAWLAWEEES